MADLDCGERSGERSGERRSLDSTMSNYPEDSSRAPSSQDEQLFITEVWDKHTDPIPLDCSQFDLHEWAKRNIHILDSAASEARHRGILFEDLSIQGSGSCLQVQPTVLSAFVRPAVSIVNFLLHKQSHKQPAYILHNFDGLVCNGELLLVLGRPGSGCSTFLKAICGYLDGLSLDPTSKIQYKGVPFARMIKEFRGEVVYNQEEDHHFPHLTVGETLEFAAYARASHIRPGNMSRDAYAKMAVQVAMALIAEMTLARAPIGAWDNSTRGLDANSALDFVQALRLSANLTKTCHAAAVYQASEPMYNTFDNVTVLYDGRQVYFGPCQHAVAYFEKMGWKRHPRQVSADFLTAITNPSEREPQAGMAEKVPRTSEDFEAYWKQSPEYAELREKMKNYAQSFPLDGPEESKLNHAKHTEQANHVRPSSPFLLSVPMQLRLCLVRAHRRSLNDRAGIIATAVVQVVISVLIGSLFYNIPDTSAGLSQRASVIFLAVLTNNLIALLEINILYSQRPIVEKHARYTFVHPFTEAFAGVIIDLPIKLLRCLIASVIIYFMAHLQREPGHFFIYILLQLVSVVTMSGLFRHLWRNFGILVAFFITFHVIYLVLTELVPGTASAPKTLSFLPGHIPAKLSPNDVEAGHRSEVSKELMKSDSQSRLLLPKQENVFSWQGLCYDIPVKGGTKRLLDDVSGWVKPGTFTALMGMSGAGKTTLLDVLSQRMTLGVVTGEMLVNGCGLDTSISRKTGYVEQNDLHCETATIREALRFSAALRQPRSVSMEEKYAFVEDVIQMLGMEDFAEAVIGNPGEGLNIEQRKLLTIGVELAAKPEVLIFLDEPTSGLESQSSLAICSFMRKLADHGQAVLATIHQPSAVMFEQFDRLLLLAKGGKTVYFGDIGSHSRTLLDYLETNGARSCGPVENPAEYILEVFSEGSQESSQTIDWVEIWKQSPQNQEVLDHLQQISSNPSQAPIINAQIELEFAMPITAQLYQVMKRDFQQYYRQPEYIMAKLSLGIVSGLFVGFSFWMSDNSNQGFQNTLFSLFLLCTIFSTMVNQIMPKFIGRRALYELRERPSRTYSWKVFIFSQIIVELPWQALLGTCTWASFYFSVYGGNQDPERQGLVFLFVLQFFFFASSFAHLVAAAVPSPVLGSMLALFMFVLSLLSNGVMQPPSALPPFWSQMHRVSPLTYYVGGISATALHGRPIHCSDREMVSFEAPAGQTCGEYLGSRDIFWDHRWRDYGILWAYFAFNIFGAIFLYYLFRVLPYSRADKARKTKS
ncbi:hypothetical protein PENANT_c006G05357 [Penicillium antarcticum]|uniref:ABC transporter domain-containing protein n=1 Tax=Penicillium antarcticum TaxID=416450 RepID=A0A1V6QE25_9EURO|nr:hypothetical protein PENANT_c006G05357 [Penicillium antarcticum]